MNWGALGAMLLSAGGVLAVGALLLGSRRALGYVNGQPVTLDLAPIGGGHYLRADAAVAFAAMREAALAEGVPFVLEGEGAAFRTPEVQQRLTKTRAEFAAPVGHSPHQAGVAVDIDLVDDATGRQRPAARWLEAHAARFGFRRTVAREPWHWEFRP